MFDRLVRAVVRMLILLVALSLGLGIALGGFGRVRFWPSNALPQVCAALFAVGLVVRLKRCLGARAADVARRRRLADASTITGAPDRVSRGGVAAQSARRSGRQDPSDHSRGE